MGSRRNLWKNLPKLLEFFVAFVVLGLGVGVVGVADGRAEHGPRPDALGAGALARAFAPLRRHPKGFAQLLASGQRAILHVDAKKREGCIFR